MWDTAGQEAYHRVRAGYYPSTDVVVVCFDVGNPDTLDDVRSRWQVEVRKHAGPRTPIVLVGTKVDRRLTSPDDQHQVNNVSEVSEFSSCNETPQLASSCFFQNVFISSPGCPRYSHNSHVADCLEAQ